MALATDWKAGAAMMVPRVGASRMRSKGLWGATTFAIALLAMQSQSKPVSTRSPKISVGAEATSYVIETALLPLRVASDPLYARTTLAVGAGAIAAVRGKAVILDRVGRVFLYDQGHVAEDTCQRLPMNVAAFEKADLFPLDESTLRTHDLQYDMATSSLFASFESYDADLKATQFEIARAKVDADGRCTGAWEEVLKGPPLISKFFYSGRGAGGKMALDGSRLYFAVGDYNLDRPSYPAAQLADSFFGKAYRYDLESRQLDVVSSGHRVPLGLMVDSRQRLWLTENGPRGGDKLDLLRAGQNYGWPYASLGTKYFSYETAAVMKDKEDAFAKPVFSWVPSIAPSQVAEVADFDRRWNGDLLVGSLKAQTLYRIHLDGDRVAHSEPISLGHRIRDFVINRGQIVVLADDGTLLTIAPDYGLLQKGTINTGTAYDRVELASCSSCHSFSDHGPLPWAPNLAGVFGREIGKGSFDRYSPPMKSKGGVWDEASLAAFLLDPAAFIPGTTMPGVHLAPEVIGRIVDDLKKDALRQVAVSETGPEAPSAPDAHRSLR